MFPQVQHPNSCFRRAASQNLVLKSAVLSDVSTLSTFTCPPYLLQPKASDLKVFELPNAFYDSQHSSPARSPSRLPTKLFVKMSLAAHRVKA